MADSVLVEIVALGNTSPLPRKKKKKNFKEEEQKKTPVGSKKTGHRLGNMRAGVEVKRVICCHF
jgi:hypothetical protein